MRADELDRMLADGLSWPEASVILGFFALMAFIVWAFLR